MSKNKKIPKEIINRIPQADAHLFMTLWLGCNSSGLTPNTYRLEELAPLAKAGIIKVTVQWIVLVDYLQSNYGILRNNYNPYKGVLESITASGFDYDPENHSIIIDEDYLITDFPSLTQPLKHNVTELEEVEKEKPAEANTAPLAVKAPKVTKTDTPKQSKILTVLTNPEFALILALLLMLGQTAHSSHSLMLLASLPEPYNTIFAISTALLMDLLIIYTVAVGNTRNSLIFFLWCAALNVFGYHINIEYWTYISIFTFIPALGIPYAVHFVSTQMNRIITN